MQTSNKEQNNNLIKLIGNKREDFKVTNFIGKIECNVETIRLFRAIDWQKPNARLETALTLSDAEQSQIWEALSHTNIVIKVGPIIGVESGLISDKNSWDKDLFFSENVTDLFNSPNGLLINLGDKTLIELREKKSDDQHDLSIRLEMGEAIIFPINKFWHRLMGNGTFILIRGFFIGAKAEALN